MTTLEAVRGSLEGVIPAVMATVATDGTPNVAYLSQVEYVDAQHVALSFQFFNRTRANILATRRATVLLLDPVSGGMTRLHVEYLRTEESGALFERMRAKLAAIASHTGMDGVFRLRGSDVYRVHQVEAVPGRRHLAAASPARCPWPALRVVTERLAACTSFEQLLDEAMASLQDPLGLRHALLLLADAGRHRLYTVASCGYAQSGLGSEIEWGQGLIGVAAREATTLRLGHATSAYSYARAMRDSQAGPADPAAAEITMPGLPDARSQIAVPLLAMGRVQGVLFAESAQDAFFGYDDEDRLALLGAQLGLAIALLQGAAETAEEPAATAGVGLPAVSRAAPTEAATRAAQTEPSVGTARTATAAPRGAPLLVRHFAPNDSVFLDDGYLIKGVAGAIFWKLARAYVDEGRDAFSNRELRLDAALGLPEVSDNLEARLILLQRRLEERGAGVRIEKTGRGRFRLCVERPLRLQSLPVG